MGKYEEALERAREIYNAPVATIVTRTFLEQIFPELKVSEDERIINRIISYLKQDIEEYPERKERIDEMLAYLEKQKEQNVVPSRETILGIWELGNFWKENPEERNGLTQLQYIQKYWFEKCDYLKEQKPAEWSKEDKNRHHYLCNLLREVWYKVDKGSCIDDAITWLEELPERIVLHSWKPSEEQIEVFFKATPVNLMPDELRVYYSLYNDLKKL